MPSFDMVLVSTAELVTCDGPTGDSAEKMLGVIPRGAVGIAGGRIAWVGPEAALPDGAIGPQTVRLDAQGGLVGPGFVDCHTHLVFAGERSAEFEQRCQGKTYLEVAAAGGGIVRTVDATRAATEDELVTLALPRLKRLLAHGVTSAEVKSGYGLDVETELKMLRVVRTLSSAQPVTLHATVLGLHAVPRGMTREAYVTSCLEDLLPRVAAEGLASTCDAFVEQSAFTPDDARRLAVRAKSLGLRLRLHVDQLTSGAGAELAAELGAATADHLEQVSPAGVAALAKAGVVAVLAPTSTLFARVKPYAPGRALRDAGVPVALCTNCNPGSSMSENVALALGLACVENGLTPAEAYLGFTRFGAQALGDATAGRIAVGGPADLVVFDAPSVRALPYHFGINSVRTVLKAGLPVSTGTSARP
ncbi:MAG: imidazolonepropionase [Archangium sp.]|nr:imidazolonepropionase [Archangium sp.]